MEMQKKAPHIILWLWFSIMPLAGQTANNIYKPFPYKFTFGVSSSYYNGFNGGNTTVRDIADLAFKANIRGFRQVVLDQFMQEYGPAYEFNNFKYLRETDSIKSISLYLSTPSIPHRATDSITCMVNNTPVKFRSESFAHLYEPIWDDSVNPKNPINENNYYATYVYNLVKSYQKQVKIYEVWNAPDFSTSINVDKLKGDAGNWWDNPPSPCDLVNLHAPFSDYVRMLRITYEVAKSVDSTALVALGGISRENFLDAILRSTDNPDQGKVTTAYPLKGGAYFDIVAYQSMPQYTLKEWDEKNKLFKYFRHSDAAAQKVIDTKTKFNNLLHKYGYNDTLYPEKHFMTSKVNIPRKQYNDRDFIGSVDAQRNFLMKLFVHAQKSNLKQAFLYTIGDSRSEAASISDLEGNDLMGLYYNLNQATVSNATLNQSGIALKTLASLFDKYEYHKALTDSLKLGTNADGAAFTNGQDTLFLLWAKTRTDLSEVVSERYTLPPSLSAPYTLFDVYAWDYSKTGLVTPHSGHTFALSATPIAINLKLYTSVDDNTQENFESSIFPNPAHTSIQVRPKQAYPDVHVTLTDISGKTLISTHIFGESDIDLHHLEPGLYCVSLQDKSAVKTHKLVIE